MIGDAVNVAARLVELAKNEGLPILVSEETRQRVGAAIPFGSAGTARVKGRSHPIQTYAPTCLEGRVAARR